MKYYDGSAWADKPIKYYDGSAWQLGTLKRWDGSSWVTVGSSGPPAYSAVIEDFEDNSLSGYSGDTGAFSVQSSTVLEGSYSLEGTAASSNVAITNTASSYGQGTTFRAKIQAGTSSSTADVLFGVQSETGAGSVSCYSTSYSPRGGSVKIVRWDSGTYNELTAKSVSTPTGETLDVVIEWTTNGGINVDYYDSTGANLYSQSATDTTYTSGGFGFLMYDGTSYWDKLGTV